MASTHGGDTVRGGFYWNTQKWDANFVEGESGMLPGAADDDYRRIPVGLVLVAAPVMGALFVIFLPFIGIALMLQQMGIASAEVAGRMLERVAPAVSPSWQPRMAYLARKGRKPADEATTATPSEAPLHGLAKEIEERRKS